MPELKAILERLRDGIALLDERNTELAEQTKRTMLAETKANESKEFSDAKAKDLDEREAKIKHIENIVEREEKANRLLGEAQEIKEQAEVRQKALDEQIKDFKAREASSLQKIADAELMNKKQAEALIKERKEFEAKIKAYKAMAAAVK